MRIPPLHDIPIGVRLGFGFAALGALLLAIMALGALNLHRNHQGLHRILHVSNAKVWHATAIREAAQSAERSLLLMAFPHNLPERPLAKIRLLSTWANLRHALRELERLESSPRGRDLLIRLYAATDAAQEAARLLGQSGDPAGPSAPPRLSLRALHPPLNLLQSLGGELVAYEKDEMDRLDGETQAAYLFTRNSFLALGLLAVVLGVVMALGLTRSIIRPLRQGVEIANRLAEGKLETEVPVARRDETGELLAAMHHMAGRLRQAKSLEAQLVQAQKLETVGQLAGGVAHDFNNLLTIINCQAQMGQLASAPGEPLHQRFVSIEEAGNRAAALTRQLLAFSRKQPALARPLDLNGVVRNLKKMLTRLIGEHIELSTLLADGLGRVNADPVQLEQILLNLAVNARDAMPSGGRLLLETGNVDLDESYTRQHIEVQPGPYVVLTVTDTGIGMSPEVRARIFEPFFTTKEVGRGTGLGLATVYGIVKQSRGHIWVYSEPGQGSTFRIYLPRVTAPSAVPVAERPHGQLLAGNGVILLAEDEPMVRVLARETLERCGYTVLEAGDGRAALETGRRHSGPIDLLLTDLVMPALGGRELAERLSAERPGLGLVFMSGYGGQSFGGVEGLPEGNVRFLQKPFAVDELARVVRQALDECRPPSPHGDPVAIRESRGGV